MHIQENMMQAENEMRLVKNDQGLLPLQFNRPMMLGLTGPHADRIFGNVEKEVLLANPKMGVTIRKGLKRFLRDSFIQLEYHPGGLVPEQLAEAMDMMGYCDVVIAVVGGETAGNLPADQMHLLETLHGLGKPLVAVVIGEDPQDLDKVMQKAEVVICCACPGLTAGEVLAQLLYQVGETK